MKRWMQAGTWLRLVALAVIWSVAIGFPVFAQGAGSVPGTGANDAKAVSDGGEGQAEGWENTWNIIIFGVYNSRRTEESELNMVMIAGIDRESLVLKTEYIPVNSMLNNAQDRPSQSIKDLWISEGYREVIQMLERDRGIRSDDYLIFEWKNIIDGINILGGLDAELSDEEFEYINAFLTETVADSGVYTTHIKAAGPVHMDGVQAVAYTRLKLSKDDNGQLERQRKILSQAWQRLTRTNIQTLHDIVAYTMTEIDTSLDAEDFEFLYRNGKRWLGD